jgi:hypothetical protein
MQTLLANPETEASPNETLVMAQLPRPTEGAIGVVTVHIPRAPEGIFTRVDARHGVRT